MKNPYPKNVGSGVAAPDYKPYTIHSSEYNAWEEGRTAGRSERDGEVAALVEALRFFTNWSVTQMEYDYLDKGIGTSTNFGKSLLKARDVLAKATEGEVKDNG